MCYFFLPLACANALAATDFVFVDVRPSRKRPDASLATFGLVTLRLLDFAIRITSFLALAWFARPSSDFPNQRTG
ncbi:hypothetical protein AWC00_12845 [Mycobacterium conspicuum]|nr:hypothetical protein AWC00_12845 [Mycobacterium conspicuum]